MELHKLPAYIERRFDCETPAASKEKQASIRRAELELQTQEFLAQGKSITEITQNIVATTAPLPTSRDQIEKPRPNKHMGKHHKNNDGIMVNLREAAQMLGIAAPTMSQWITKGKIKTAARNSESNERLVLKKDVLALKQQRDAQKESRQ
jgi:hypothetical protein